MRIKLIERGLLCVLSILLISSNLSAQNNQTLINHKRSRELNKEGYRAYLQGSWNLALKKFRQSITLDPYYTYPVYNSACVLSRRERPEDALQIFRLLTEVLLQETGPNRSVHQAKMQKDPDLAWFRRTEPELFILLNEVVLDYNVRRIYRKLRNRRTWNISINRQHGSRYRKNRYRDGSYGDGSYDDGSYGDGSYDDGSYDDGFEDSSYYDGDGDGFTEFGDSDSSSWGDNGVDEGSQEPQSQEPQSQEQSITVTPDDEPVDVPSNSTFNSGSSSNSDSTSSSNSETRSQGSGSDQGDSQAGLQRDSSGQGSGDSDDGFSLENSSASDASDDPFSQNGDFNPFSDDDDSNPFGSPKDFPGYDEEGSEEFFPLVPQSLRHQYRDSELSLSLISRQADGADQGINRITFKGYRYKWNFQMGRDLFQMSGFFVVRGNVLILETFASSPKELRNLPFDWKAFRSLFFVYQPQSDDFYAINLNGDAIEIY